MFVPLSVRIWLLISSIIVTWDYTFVLLRPETLPGGSLHSYYWPYAKYIQLDTLYSNPKDRFLYFQSWFNCFESILAFSSLLILMRKGRQGQIIGAFMAFAVSSFTFWKTFLYFAYDEAFIDYKMPVEELIGIFFVPNSFCILMPGYSMWRIAREFYKFCTKMEERETNNKKM